MKKLNRKGNNTLAPPYGSMSVLLRIRTLAAAEVLAFWLKECYSINVNNILVDIKQIKSKTKNYQRIEKLMWIDLKEKALFAIEIQESYESEIPSPGSYKVINLPKKINKQ